MRYTIVLVFVLLLAMAGCNKTTIDPSRYESREQSVQTSTQPEYQEVQVQEEHLMDDSGQSPSKGEATSTVAGDLADVEGVVTYQVGVFSDAANSASLKNALEAKGFSSTSVREVVNEKPIYRVTASYNGTDVQAREKMAELGIHDAVLLSGVPSQKKSAQSPASVTQQYKEQVGAYQVGVFSDTANADAMVKKLNENGFRGESRKEGNTHHVLAIYHGSEAEAKGRLAELGVSDPIPVREDAVQAQSAETMTETSGTSKADTPPASSSQAPGNSFGRHTFQVGSFASLDNADALKSKLEGNGFESGVELFSLDGQTRYRVVATRLGTVSQIAAKLEGLGIYNPVRVKR